MKEQIVKKYVQALISIQNEQELQEISESLKIVKSAFLVEKFTNIIKSKNISNIQKVKLIFSFIENPSQKFTNFIKLLGLNDRLELIPSIVDELAFQRAKKQNEFEGFIQSSFDITAQKITDLEQSFSKKLNAKIKLKHIKTQYSGIKINIEDLGVEVSFSIDRLKSLMAEYILKAI